MDDVLDPRLRRIFTLSEQSHDTKFEENNDCSTTSGSYTPHDFVNNSVSNVVSNSNPVVSDVCVQRLDPRRKNRGTDKTSADTMSLTSTVIPSNNRVSNTNLDMQSVLRQSDWYKDLSSKHKIMVNQQLAIVSTELKKYHQDQSVNKMFDLTFVNQNPLLQQVLTNLGIYIDENGQFLQLQTQKQMDYKQCNDMLPEMTATIPGMPFIRPPPLNSMNNNRFMNTNTMMFGSNGSGACGTDGGLVRPGLLGVAPGIPFNAYDTDDSAGIYQQQQAQQQQHQQQHYDEYAGNIDSGVMGSNSSGAVASLFDAPIACGFDITYPVGANLYDSNNSGYFSGNNMGNASRNYNVPDRNIASGVNTPGEMRNYRSGNRPGNNSDRWAGGGNSNVGRSGNNIGGGSGGRHLSRRNNYDRNSRRDKN